MPNVNDFLGMAGKFVNDMKTSIANIVQDYKEQQSIEEARAAATAAANVKTPEPQATSVMPEVTPATTINPEVTPEAAVNPSVTPEPVVMAKSENPPTPEIIPEPTVSPEEVPAPQTPVEPSTPVEIPVTPVKEEVPPSFTEQTEEPTEKVKTDAA